jgi:hypothetical protein
MVFERGVSGRRKETVVQTPRYAPKKSKSKILPTPFDIMMNNEGPQAQVEPEEVQSLSKQQVMGQTTKNWISGLRESILNRQRLASQKSRILPEEQYIMQEEGPTWSKGQVLSGSQIISIYGTAQKQQKKSAGEYLRGTSQLLRQVHGLPSGTTFTPTKEGYDINIPETAQLDWNKYYLDRSKQLPPGVREINQFGQGIFTDIVSIVSPIAGVAGKQKEFNIMTTIAMSKGTTVNPFDIKEYGKNLTGGLKAGQYGIHYVNPLDIMLEPLRMAPKGSTDILLQHPGFLAGGFGGEVATLMGFNYALKGVTLGVSKTVRFTAPKIIASLRTTFPEMTPRIFTRIGETTIGKHFGLWTKGYMPVAKGTEDIIGNVFLKTKGVGLDRSSYLKNIFKGTVNRQYGLAEREFISPEAMKNLFRSSTEITMASRATGFEFTIERTGYQKGILGGMKRIYEELRVASGPGGTIFDVEDVLGPRAGIGEYYGGFYNVAPSTRGILASEIAYGHSKVDWLYNVVLPYQKGRGIPFVMIIPKGFAKNTEAAASILRQIETPLSRHVTSGLTKGLSEGGVSVFTPIFNIGGDLGELGTYMFLRGAAARQATIPKQLRVFLRTETINRPIFDVMRSSVVDMDKMQGVMSISKTGFMELSVSTFDMGSLSLPDVMSVPKLSLRAMIPFPSIVTTVPFIPAIPLGSKASIEGGGYGRGRRGKRGARYRKHPVELYDLLRVRVTI